MEDNALGALPVHSGAQGPLRFWNLLIGLFEKPIPIFWPML